jgi:hypothetical protein
MLKVLWYVWYQSPTVPGFDIEEGQYHGHVWLDNGHHDKLFQGVTSRKDNISRQLLLQGLTLRKDSITVMFG